MFGSFFDFPKLGNSGITEDTVGRHIDTGEIAFLVEVESAETIVAVNSIAPSAPPEYRD